MPDDRWQAVLEKTHDAVCDFARAELLALTRRAVHRLKRIKASGIYGEDHGHRSLWKEYCHEVNEGPHQALESAWDHTLRGILEELVNAVPRHTSMLLTILALCEFEDDANPEMVGSVWLDGIVSLLRNRLAEEAAGPGGLLLRF